MKGFLVIFTPCDLSKVLIFLDSETHLTIMIEHDKRRVRVAPGAIYLVPVSR